MQHWYADYDTLNGEWRLLLFAHNKDGHKLNSLQFENLLHVTPTSHHARWAAIGRDAGVGCTKERTHSSATLIRVNRTLPQLFLLLS